MIKEISLQNFKLYKENTTFSKLKSLNILTGVNGRGKSTLLQSLLLPKQTLAKNETAEAISLNGFLVNLGNAVDVKNVNSSRSSVIKFEFVTDAGKVVYNLSVSDDKSQQLEIDRVFINDKEYTKDLSGFRKLVPLTAETNIGDIFTSLQYISADRIGPQLNYQPSIEKDFVDARGMSSACVLYNHKDDHMQENSIGAIYDIFPGVNEEDLMDTSFNGILEFWLTKMFGNTKVTAQYVDTANLYVLQYTTDKAKDSKPTNVGYGYSYVLPVMIAGLLAKNGEVLIVENPEAHLHPSAQAILGKFLAWIAKYNGVQVFIETHSEHMVNAFRVLVVQQIIESEELNVMFFDDSYTEYARSIPVDSEGQISYWPDRFFDQAEADLKLIVGF